MQSCASKNTPPKPKRMIIYFVAITTILFAIMMFIYNINKNRNVRLLSAYLFIYSFYAIAHYTTFYSTNPTLVAICWNNLSPIFTLGGPVLFFYVKSSLEDKIIWKWSDLIHLIPFIIICIGLLPYLLSPFENKLQAANLIIQDVNNIKKIPMNSIFSNLFIYLSRPLMAIIYISASIRLLIRKNNSEKNPSRQFQLITKWITVLLAISFLIIVIMAFLGSNLFKHDVRTMLDQYQDLHAIAGALFLMLPLSLLLFPQILYGIPIIEKNTSEEMDASPNNAIKKSTDVPAKNIDAFKELSEKIIAYFDQEKPYLKQNFSLTELATAMNAPQHHISYCFSDFINTSFTKLRAAKRVEYAKTLLQQGLANDFTIDKIAELSGFSSRSTFFSTFKEYTGMTPTDYMEQSK